MLAGVFVGPATASNSAVLPSSCLAARSASRPGRPSQVATRSQGIRPHTALDHFRSASIRCRIFSAQRLGAVGTRSELVPTDGISPRRRAIEVGPGRPCPGQRPRWPRAGTGSSTMQAGQWRLFQGRRLAGLGFGGPRCRLGSGGFRQTHCND